MPSGMKPPLRLVLLFASVALGCALLLLLRTRPPVVAPAPEPLALPRETPAEAPVATETPAIDRLLADAQARAALDLLTNLQLLLARRDARAQEALLTFKDDESYRRFLARAQEAG